VPTSLLTSHLPNWWWAVHFFPSPTSDQWWAPHSPFSNSLSSSSLSSWSDVTVESSNPRPVSGSIRYHGSHGQSGAAAPDLGGGMQQSQSEDVIAMGMRQGCGMMPWLWLLASTTPARVPGTTCTRINRWATWIPLSAFWLTCYWFCNDFEKQPSYCFRLLLSVKQSLYPLCNTCIEYVIYCVYTIGNTYIFVAYNRRI
jgi:hypothetical protein